MLSLLKGLELCNQYLDCFRDCVTDLRKWNVWNHQKHEDHDLAPKSEVHWIKYKTLISLKYNTGAPRQRVTIGGGKARGSVAQAVPHT